MFEIAGNEPKLFYLRRREARRYSGEEKWELISQANFAVDNALNRLSHHPELFPLGYGNADKVGEEGQHFLADRVIDRWIQNTSADCENQLSEKQRIVEGLEALLNDWQ